MILTAQLMRDITAEKIIPVIRRNELEIVLPTFLGARLYIDFRDPTQYEAKYAELIREIHGAKIQPRPPLGKNPFSEREEFRTPSLSTRSERYVSPPLRGVVTFDFSNNNGCYVIGSGDMVFETMWSGGSNSAIHVYSDSSSIHNLALAIGAKEITDIDDASAFDTSSRVRMPQLGEIVVWQNIAGYYAAVRIEALNCRSHGRDKDEVTFSYAIQHDRTPSFKMMLL
ncbi:MAG: toll/interleukin-1 receptor domain-containing protein [Candidatus Kapaibacterium sp.]